MLMGLKQPLTQGERVKATLDFAKAGKLDLEFVVESMGAQGPSGAMPAACGAWITAHGSRHRGSRRHGSHALIRDRLE